MNPPVVVAQCGRDESGAVIEEGKHLAEAVYLENQPEGTGWFIPPWCPACEAAMDADPVHRQETDEYILSPEFRKITDHVEGYVAFRRIMDNG